MTNAEIRQKGIECGENFGTMCASNMTINSFFIAKCTNNCPYADVERCDVAYGYEHGFAEGVEEGKRLALADLAEHDKETRHKTIEEFFRRLNLKIIELPLDDFVVRDILGEIRKIAMQMKEGAENDHCRMP